MMAFLPAPEALAAFAAASLLLTLTPGPDMAFFLANTFARGRGAGFVALAGAGSGLVIHTVLAALGLSALLASSQTAFDSLRVAGAIYLLWIAIQTVRTGSKLTVETASNDIRSLLRIFTSGFLINLMNPKIVLFFLTFLPQFVTAGDPAAGKKFFFLGLLFVAIGGTGSAMVILGAHQVTGVLRRRPSILRVLDWLFASVFSAFAIRLLLPDSQ